MFLACFINGVLAIVTEFQIAFKPANRRGKGPKLLQEQARSDGLEGAELVNDSVCIQAQLGGGFRGELTHPTVCKQGGVGVAEGTAVDE